MRHLIVLFLAAAASGAVVLTKPEWNMFENLVPKTYFTVIQNTEDLHNNLTFLKKISLLAYKSTKFFVQTLYARQNYLNRFVDCSCHMSSFKFQPVIPYLWGLNINYGTPMEELVRVQTEGTEFSRQMSDVVKMVTEDCPMADQCMHRINDQFMDILLGKEDDMILEAIWHTKLPSDYPKLFEPVHSTEYMSPYQQKYNQFLDMFSTYHSPSYVHFDSFYPSFAHNQHHYPYYKNYMNHMDYYSPNTYSYKYRNHLYNYPMHMNYDYFNKLNMNDPFNFNANYFHNSYSHYTPSRYFDFYDYITDRPIDTRYDFFDRFNTYNRFNSYKKSYFDHTPFDSYSSLWRM